MKKDNNKKLFPKDFLWSASTSAYQFEGAWNVDGKGPSVQDINENIPEGTTDFKVTSDHYNHLEEDVKLLAELGLKAYRFSIAWTRIIPDGDGEINQKGIDFYNRLINLLIKHKIEPIVTMYHFDIPAKLEDKDGWSNPKTIDAFVRFAKILFENYGDRVKYWLTINEQNMIILVGQIIGMKMPKSDNYLKSLYQMNHYMMLAQSKTMKLCHDLLPNAKIGPAPNISAIYPASSKPEDQIAAMNMSCLRNWLYLDAAVRGIYNPTVIAWLKKNNAMFDIKPGDMDILKSGKPDFIAFNYYNTSTAKMPESGIIKDQLTSQQKLKIEPDFYEQVDNPNLGKTQFGWEIDPTGFRTTFRETYDRYGLPLLVTENGLGAYDEITKDFKIHDDYRIEYYTKHIQAMKDAIDEGVEVIGYSPWSAIDLVSTHEGIKKRYGFVYVNRDEFDLKDLKRYKKDSFFWYQNLIRTNGESL
ncbi:glycoside hydrolase family 1 protein [Spiroplasma alleghenense]|uniref:6-phospho-beta-glucosidase n=1 Tax=Spiroplasma alleghenense TaxID=216931 RepID=A0A345Z501_9MOLU|nr:glycoside hydrolase family 1 protein [Spiroplasma alleghenense]AXK51680.1 6-phospho-beta-glucosidase [Spiroplasma alleghenense]